MEPVRILTIVALTLFLLEGFALSVFPNQSKEFLIRLEPRMLQAAGLTETAVAAGLLAGLLLG